MRRFWQFLVLILCAALAMGAYLEQEQSVSEQVSPPQPMPTPFSDDACGAREAVMTMVQGVDLGDVQWRMGVAIVPIVSASWRGDGSITSLDRAIRRGRLKIREHGGGLVPWLEVKNTSRNPILLMAGEILLGGKQNRLVASDFLVRPRSDWVRVPVFCGEQHRWTGGSGGMFKSSKTMVPAPMRRELGGGATQDSVWRGAGEQLSRFGASTETQNIQKIYEDSELGKALKCFHKPSWKSFPRGTIGMVVVAGRRVLGIEVLASNRLFKDNWRKVLDSMLAGYPPLLNFCGGVGGYDEMRHGVNPREAARRALRNLTNANFDSSFDGGAGCGVRVNSLDGLAGQALVYNGALARLGVVSAWPMRRSH